MVGSVCSISHKYSSLFHHSDRFEGSFYLGFTAGHVYFTHCEPCQKFEVCVFTMVRRLR